MLNAYFEVAVPRSSRRYGGDVDRIIGDALMVTFNKRGDQPDHARRAAAAGLAMQQATAAVAVAAPGLAALPGRHQQRTRLGRACSAPTAGARTPSSATPSTPRRGSRARPGGASPSARRRCGCCPVPAGARSGS